MGGQITPMTNKLRLTLQLMHSHDFVVLAVVKFQMSSKIPFFMSSFATFVIYFFGLYYYYYYYMCRSHIPWKCIDQKFGNSIWLLLCRWANFFFFQTDRFFWLNLNVFVGRYWKHYNYTLYSANLDTFHIVYRFWDISIKGFNGLNLTFEFRPLEVT